MIATVGLLFVTAYSAPLTRVHIDSNAISHTPQLIYVRDDSTAGVDLDISGQAVQYILQLEHHSGFGAQITAALGRASADFVDRDIDISGILYGGQARIYAEVLTIPTSARPHALTSFVNFRAVHVNADSNRASLSQTALSAGAGFMAEISLGQYVSVLPYAWFSPSLMFDKDVRVAGGERVDFHDGPSLNRPMRAGLDVWIYPSGVASNDHFALSAIVSLIDRTGNRGQETAFVLGYTF